MAEAPTTKFTILQRIQERTRGVVTGGPEVSDTNERWEVIGEKEGRDRDHALRLFFAGGAGDIDGVYTAVAASGWKPRRVAIKSEPKITIGDVE